MAGYQALLPTPKTQKGWRLVALDPATTTVLAELWDTREEESIREGRRVDPADLVFTNEHGPSRAGRPAGDATDAEQALSRAGAAHLLIPVIEGSAAPAADTLALADATFAIRRQFLFPAR